MKIIDILNKRQRAGKKSIAVLIDPDKVEDASKLKHLINLGTENCIDFFLVGGSLITTTNLGEVISIIKENVSSVPVILFPGNSLQIDPQADGILFLSLISGRNPDLLIGQQVLAAPMLKASGLEVLSTGYMLVDCGRPTTASYMSGTMPIPHNKPAIAACTALAGELLGLKLIYLDGGSGAQQPISPLMVEAVAQSVEIPIIVGGGIVSADKAEAALLA